MIVETSDKQLSAFRNINVTKALVLLNPIYIDFGVTAFGPPFNTINNPKNNAVPNLIDNKGNETGINFEITDEFEGENGSGVIDNLLGLPPQVSSDAFWGSNGNPKAEIKFSRLNRNDYYDFNFYGSRRDVGDNRETAYTVKGRYQAVTVYQNSANNTSVISSVKKIRPNEQGEIIVTITAGPNNNNASKYFYLNAMTIDPSSN